MPFRFQPFYVFISWFQSINLEWKVVICALGSLKCSINQMLIAVIQRINLILAHNVQQVWYTQKIVFVST